METDSLQVEDPTPFVADVLKYLHARTAVSKSFAHARTAVSESFAGVVRERGAHAASFADAFMRRRDAGFLPESIDGDVPALANALRSAVRYYWLEPANRLNQAGAAERVSEQQYRALAAIETHIDDALQVAFTDLLLQQFIMTVDRNGTSEGGLDSERLREHASRALLAYVVNADNGTTADPW